MGELRSTYATDSSAGGPLREDVAVPPEGDRRPRVTAVVTCRARSSSVASASRVTSFRSEQPTSGASSQPRKAPLNCACSQADSNEPGSLRFAPRLVDRYFEHGSTVADGSKAAASARRSRRWTPIPAHEASITPDVDRGAARRPPHSSVSTGTRRGACGCSARPRHRVPPPARPHCGSGFRPRSGFEDLVRHIREPREKALLCGSAGSVGKRLLVR